MLTTLAIANYRSLRDIVVPLRRLTVVTGANGSGKSSLYRSLRLLADAARNGAVAALAYEGGLPSTLWAGPESIGRSVRERRHPVQGTVRTKAVALRLGFAADDYGYAIDFGLPRPGESKFALDPEIKRECVWTGPVLRKATLLADRHNGMVVGDDGGISIGLTDSMLSELPMPELMVIRDRIRSWRFYDQFRTDALAPARIARVGTRTPVLGDDGGDLAAALETIREVGYEEDLSKAVDDAFPGSRIDIETVGGRMELKLHQHGLIRPLGTAELSDGTLRYLLWVAVLLTPRPPELLVLNEPETSLHPDLIAPLAALITTASARTQLVVVSHNAILIRSLTAAAEQVGDDLGLIELVKEFGETTVVGQGPLDGPSWQWPKR